MAVSQYAFYKYDSDRKLIETGTLTYSAVTDKYTYVDEVPNINQGEVGNTQIIIAMPDDSYGAAYFPFVTIVSPQNWVSGLLAAEKEDIIIIESTVETTYQVAKLTLGLIGQTRFAGIYGFVLGWIGDGEYITLDGTSYVVDDGVNDYDNIEADVYAEIYAAVEATFAGYADRLIDMEAYLLATFGYIAGQTSALSMLFNTATTVEQADLAIGEMRFSDDAETLEVRISENVVLQIGQEQVYPTLNKSGSDIANGVPVYVSGELGNSGKALITPAGNGSYVNATAILGVTTETIADNAMGKVCIGGLVHELDLSSFSIGDWLYLDTVAGTLTATKPVPSATVKAIVEVGIVLDNDATDGILLVAPRVHYDITDLSGVKITSIATNDILIRTADGIFENITKTAFLATLQAEVDLKELASNKKTDLSSDSDMFYPTVKAINTALVGLKRLKGDFGAVIGTDLPASPENGWTYRCDSDAYTSVEASLTFNTNDTATWWDDISLWVKNDASDAVTSVNTRTGAVVGLEEASNKKTDLVDDSDIFYVSQKAINTGLDLKVDKVTGSSLVTNVEIAHLEALDTQAELDAKFLLKADNADLLITKAKVVEIEKQQKLTNVTLANLNPNQESKVELTIQDKVSILPVTVVERPAELVTLKGLSLYQSVLNGDFDGDITNWSALLGVNGVYDSGSIKLEATASVVTTYQEIVGVSGEVWLIKGELTKNSGTQASFYVLPQGATSGVIGTLVSATEFDALSDGEMISVSTLVTLTNDGFRIVCGRTGAQTYSLNLDNVRAYKISDSPYPTETADQWSDRIGSLYWEGTQDITNPKMLSVGKNLFDGELEIGTISTTTGDDATDATSVRSINYITVKPSTDYIMDEVSSSTRIYEYDINQNFIQQLGVGNTITTSSQTVYLRFKVTGIAVDAEVQLEEGTTATTYTAYNSSEYTILDTFRSVGTAQDEAKYIDNVLNKEAWVNTVAVVGVVSVDTTNYPLAKDGGAFTNYLTAGGSESGVIGTDSTTASGTLYYEVALAVKSQPQAINDYILTAPRGSLIFDDSLDDIGIYDSGITLATAYANSPIDTLVEIGKYDESAEVWVMLDIADATVASGGLSFTHTGISDDDIVYFKYIRTNPNFISNLTLNYYDSRYVMIDTVTSTVYNLTWSVVDGVLTSILTEVV
jgi:hypothetical protein